MAGIAASAGPLLGGLLVPTVGWRWVSLVNLPVGAACPALTLRCVSRSPGARPGPGPARSGCGRGRGRVADGRPERGRAAGVIRRRRARRTGPGRGPPPRSSCGSGRPRPRPAPAALLLGHRLGAVQHGPADRQCLRGGARRQSPRDGARLRRRAAHQHGRLRVRPPDRRRPRLVPCAGRVRGAVARRRRQRAVRQDTVVAAAETASSAQAQRAWRLSRAPRSSA